MRSGQSGQGAHMGPSSVEGQGCSSVDAAERVGDQVDLVLEALLF
ncbi:MAG: hypothetical protein ACK56I_23125 [bacterium]